MMHLPYLHAMVVFISDCTFFNNNPSYREVLPPVNRFRIVGQSDSSDRHLARSLLGRGLPT
jgi:hypothetical protein